ncbi:hypothetical protein FBU30_009665 [Linnemannia zychae]|nr:hypothetical protein FBU30_009665 [Linnemannia zychae]
MVCHVDPETGVFTMMSAFNLTDPNYVPDPSVPQRPSGGFQYNPHTSEWSDFKLSDDYLWGDVTDSFALFAWPGTTTLVQANVGTATTVALGTMTKDKDGSPLFVNALNWTLDPLIYGYPSRLVFGNNVLYQFGTLVANNRTGKLDIIMTRIPLSGSLDSFSPSTKLQTYNASSMSNCAPGYLSTSFYQDILYVFCQGADGPLGPGPGVFMRFKDGPSYRDNALGPIIPTDIDRLSGAAIQPIGGVNENKALYAFIVNAAGYLEMQSISLAESTLGIGHWLNYGVNITGPYGEAMKNPQSHVLAIIGGSIAGVLFVMALVLYLLLRKRWPSWRRKLRHKIVEAMMKEDQLDKSGSSDKECINKIEDPSSSTYNSMVLEGRDKILVTEDMEENNVDVSTGYMKDVGLQNHPRPKIAMSLGSPTAISTGNYNGSDGHAKDRLGDPPATSRVHEIIGHSSLLKSFRTTDASLCGQDIELATQSPQQVHSIATSKASRSPLSTPLMPPLPKPHVICSHYPTAPYISSHSESSPTPPPPLASPIPFRFTGSPLVPPSISSKELKAWSQHHNEENLDFVPPYTNILEDYQLTSTYLPSSYVSTSSSPSISSSIFNRPAAFPIPHSPSAPPAKGDRQQHESRQRIQLQQSTESMPDPTPRAPQTILPNTMISSSFSSLGYTTGISRRIRRSI